MRKPLIAANWKMYKTPQDSVDFFKNFLPLVAGHTRDDIAFFPPITSLTDVLTATTNTGIAVGAQNMHWLNEGAYTGETSPIQLAAIGCSHVILGHSERRLYSGETNECVNLKLKAAIAHGFSPIVCIGETLAERESNQTEAVLREQVRIALLNVKPSEAQSLVIAYEPIWAIGTGLSATREVASEAHNIIRHELARSCGEESAQKTRILYGGSVNPENVARLMQQEGIDGALVGSVSLDASTFAKIVKYSA